jgi:hypothetical protein
MIVLDTNVRSELARPRPPLVSSTGGAVGVHVIDPWDLAK